MVLSCCDFFGLLTNHPLMAVVAMFWLTGNEYPSWVDLFTNLAGYSLGFSLLALLVMNFERYLATYYPIFHHAPVTKRQLLSLLGILSSVHVALTSMSVTNFISLNLHSLIFLVIVGPPMVFINYKLFKIARKNGRNNGISSEIKRSFSFKKLIQLFAGSRLFCAATSSRGNLHQPRNRLKEDTDVIK